MYRYPKLATRIKKPDPEPIARKLVKDWSVDKQGLGISFEDRPSIYVKDTTTPANDTDITLEKDGLDTFSSFFTYTSPSIKNVRQADGYLKYAAHNLNNFDSEDLTTWSGVGGLSSRTADLITEDSGTSVHLVGIGLTSGTAVGSAPYGWTVEAKPNGRNYISLTIQDTTNRFAVATFELTGSGSVTQTAGGSTDGTVLDTSIVALSDGWYRCTIIGYCPGFNGTNDQLVCSLATTGTPTYDTAGRESYTGDGSSGAYIRKGHGYFYPADTTYIRTTSALRYAIPLQYDLGNKAEGVLIEPAATNLVTESQDFTDAAWTGGNTATLAFDADGPDGVTNSAVTLVDDSGTGTGFVDITESFTVSISTAYTFSVYAKADQLSFLCLTTVSFTTPANGGTYFNLSTGAVGTTASGHTGAIEDAGNGWYRCSITFTTDGTDTTGDIKIRLADADNDNIVDRDGTSSILIYGAQLESGSVATSLIKTFGATATRAADQITKPSSSLPLNEAKASIYVSAKPRDINTSRIIWSLNDDSLNALFRADQNAKTILWNQSISQIEVDAGTLSANTTFKLSSAYAADDLASSLNGATVVSNRSTSGTVPSGFTTLDIGQNRVGSAQFNGLVKDLAYYPERIPNSKLEVLAGGVAETAWRGPKAQYWVDGEPDALSIDFTDDHFKTNGNSDFYGSCWVLQSSQASYREDFNGVPTDFLTYTSPSAKNIICDDGNLKYAPHNTFLNSEDFSNTGTSDGWNNIGLVTVTTNAVANPLDGEVNADLVVPTTDNLQHYLRQIPTASRTPQEGYVSVYAKAAGYDYVFFRSASAQYTWFNVGNGTLGTGNPNWDNETITDVGNGWYRCSANFTFGGSSQYIYIQVGEADNTPTFAGDGSSGVYLWGAQLSTYPADTSYVPTTSAAAYALPIEFYPSGTIKGLLAEPAATNLATDSNDFSAASWTNVNSVEAQDATGPDGVANSAWTLTDDSGTGTGSVYIYDNYTVATSTNYVFSVYAKSDQLSWIRLTANSFTTPVTGSGAYFDLGNGAVGTVDAGLNNGANIEDVGNGWYRCSMSFTTDGSDTAGDILIQVAEADGDAIVDRDGTSSILIYGAQFETGLTPTSLIKTYGATATRATDHIDCILRTIPFSNTIGSSYLEYIAGNDLSGTKVLIYASSANGRPIYQADDDARIFDGTSIEVSSNALGTTSVHRIVSTYDVSNGLAISVDGEAANTGASFDGTMGEGDTSGALYLFSQNGVSNARGHYRRVVIIPRLVSNTDIATWSDTGELP